jgi:ornithine--oxo-acid transaminase
MWAIEFGEPTGKARSYKWVEKLQPGLFSQLVVVPLFREHRILIQVAGHGLQVIKGLPPLVVTGADIEEFAAALDASVAGASHVPRSMAGFALTAAGIR